ncbi:adenylate/guanylate cyclase domain-containing protein [Cupriavidus necator]|uniref:adenylate/guanylate cyclase domain-containing protein n=1 Tax=Cupriavidus necator TaxID=106590 RepID=UPI00059F8130
MITVIVYGFIAIKRFTRYSKSSKCCLYATTTQANTQYCRHANGREQQVTEQLLLNVLPAPVAGRLKLYDLWGDTVNIASRMESQGVITDATRGALPNPSCSKNVG